MATWKKVIVSGSDISQLNNDLNYAREGVLDQNLSGSFSGSFTGDGSNLTGVVGTISNALEDGNGIANFSYDGSTSGVTVAVEASGSTLTVGASGVAVAADGITNVEIATDAVNSDSIEAGAVDTTELADDAVTNAKIADDAVDTAQLADGAVDADRLASDSVTLGKIADGAFSVTGSGDLTGQASISGDGVNVSLSINDDAVDNAAIADDSITVAQLSGSAVVTEAEGIGSNDVDTAVPTAAAVKDYVDNQVSTADLDISTDSGNIDIDLDSETLGINGKASRGIAVSGSGTDVTIEISDGGVTNDMLAGSIANSKLVNDSVTIGTTEVDLGTTAATVAGLTLTGAVGSGSFSGSFQGDGSGLTNVPASGINLADLTDGNGIADFTYDGGAAASIAVEASGSTMTVTSTGIAVASDGITNVEIATDAVNSDSILAGAVDTAELADNSVTQAKLNASVAGTGLSGGGGTALSVDYGSTAGTAAEGNSTVTFTGTANEITVSDSSAQAIGGDVAVTIGLPDDVTISQDLTVARNLVVQGTASFQHTEDYQVADRFILLASGSTAAGDGGIVIQQTTQDEGEVFGFDAANLRFGMSGSFDASQNAFTPDAFMAAVVEGTGNDPDAAPSRYDKKGNIFIANNEDIYIYS